MDFQIISTPSFYYQVFFIIISALISFVLSKYLRKFLAKKRVKSQEIFKLVLLGMYVHVEPLLFYLVFTFLLSIGYFISFLDTDNFSLICLIQIISLIIFFLKLIISIIRR